MRARPGTRRVVGYLPAQRNGILNGGVGFPHFCSATLDGANSGRFGLIWHLPDPPLCNHNKNFCLQPHAVQPLDGGDGFPHFCSASEAARPDYRPVSPHVGTGQRTLRRLWPRCGTVLTLRSFPEKTGGPASSYTLLLAQ